MNVKNHIPLTGEIRPENISDTFPTHDSEFGKGDKHVVNISERNGIPEERRYFGMLAHLESGTSYQLTKGLVDNVITNNANWKIFTSGSGGGGIIAVDSIDLIALVTSSNGDQATNFVLAITPVDKSLIYVSVNGKIENVGDAVKTKEFYFSGDAGVTARSFDSSSPNGQIQSGDKLFFNGTIAGYQLNATDRINIYQQIT